MRTTDRLSLPPDGKPFHDQPQWRNDFPIDWPQDEFVARRDFTKFLVLTSFAFVVGQWWIALQNLLRERRGIPPITRIAKLSDLAPGQTLIFHYPDPHEPCVLVRTAGQRFVAFSQRCTHLSCAVRPEPEKGQFYCPCHHGFFDLNTGVQTGGPPRRPLPRIKLEIRGDSIYATGMEVRS
jgi:nitrite reductase/ring-hydroxylating ferredoxin subunit